MSRRRSPGLPLVVAIALLVAACATAPSGDPSARSADGGGLPTGAATGDLGVAIPDGVWQGEVVRISDGDTLWVEVVDEGPSGPPMGTEVKLRLLRIDTPELARDGQPAECLAQAATDHLAGLVPVGTRVLAAYDVEVQDRFGRDLVHLWRDDGTWVNGRMLADGFATVVTFPPNEAYTDEALDAERSARADGRGLWAPDAC